MPKHTGFFVTFEGTEGAGKSTLIRILAKKLEDQGRKVRVTREPGGIRVSERIRAILLEEPMDPWAELFLYEAARAEHLAKVILPALGAGETVLCDRFTDSSLAYQGYARGLPWKSVHALNRQATQGLKPNLTVLVDIDPAQGLERATERTRFEEEGVRFQSRVRKGFLKSMAEEPKRWFKVNSGKTGPEQLAERVLGEIIRRTTQSAPRRKKK